jgi:hypothetical protein
LIILFFTRSFFADAGTIGDEDKAIDDGPGPASAVIVVAIRYGYDYVCVDTKLDNRNQARRMLIS